MKKIITILAPMVMTLGVANAQTNATNWTAQDCSAASHTLFTDLDNGKTVVMVWVMPCGSCVNGATAAYNAAQSFATSNPGKVVYYLADDLGDATCSTLNSWITSNSIGDISKMTVFSNAGNMIKESDLGGSGMPHVAVIGGGLQHKVYFNQKNAAADNQTAITAAISSSIAALNVTNVANEAGFTVSPNPVTNTLSVTYNKAVEKVSIISLNGQVVTEVAFAKGKLNPAIDVSGIAPGVYTIKLTDVTGQSAIQKIVKE